jgi:hypothetical protein
MQSDNRHVQAACARLVSKIAIAMPLTPSESVRRQYLFLLWKAAEEVEEDPAPKVCRGTL